MDNKVVRIIIEYIGHNVVFNYTYIVRVYGTS